MVVLLMFLMILIVLHLNTYNTGNYGKKIVQIMVPLKYLINFWRILEMPLINCEINIFLTWSEKYIIVTENYGHQDPKFAILIQKFMLQL